MSILYDGLMQLYIFILYYYHCCIYLRTEEVKIFSYHSAPYHYYKFVHYGMINKVDEVILFLYLVT